MDRGARIKSRQLSSAIESIIGDRRLDESALIVRARQKDPEAWAALMREHQEAVFRLAYLILRDPEAAKDVTQETFVRAYRALDRFDDGRPMRPWLLRIATNRAYNWQRSLGRYWRALRRYRLLEPAVSPGRNPPEKTVEQRETARRVWGAIQDLNDPDQEIIYLRIFLELSVAETAETLEIAEGTVKSRLHRALQRLKKVIREDYASLTERAHP